MDSPRTIIQFPKTPKRMDCQGERSPFLVVRTKASDVVESLKKQADANRIACRRRIESSARLDAKLGDPIQTAQWLRQLATEIEVEGDNVA